MRRWPVSRSPGAHYIRTRGCTCSAVMNAYGVGVLDLDNPVFEITPSCPFHGADAVIDPLAVFPVALQRRLTEDLRRYRESSPRVVTPPNPHAARRRPIAEPQFSQATLVCGRCQRPVMRTARNQRFHLARDGGCPQ